MLSDSFLNACRVGDYSTVCSLFSSSVVAELKVPRSAVIALRLAVNSGSTNIVKKLLSVVEARECILLEDSRILQGALSCSGNDMLDLLLSYDGIAKGSLNKISSFVDSEDDMSRLAMQAALALRKDVSIDLDPPIPSCGGSGGTPDRVVSSRVAARKIIYLGGPGVGSHAPKKREPKTYHHERDNILARKLRMRF